MHSNVAQKLKNRIANNIKSDKYDYINIVKLAKGKLSYSQIDTLKEQLIILALENMIADVIAKGSCHNLSSFPNVTLHVICINTQFEIRKSFEL